MSRGRLSCLASALLICAALVSAGVRAQEPQAATQAPPPGLEELKQKIQDVLTKYRVPGAGIVLVAKDHIIWTGGVGKADVAAGKAVTDETIFRVGSISKSFVALALLKLQEEGKIDLNAKLHDVARELTVQNPWQATNPIRIANVLEHSAGFDDMHRSCVYNVQDPGDMKLFDVLQRCSASLVSRWPPGSRTAYSNPDYGIAGYLIEKASGEAYDLYIRENILVPLGMLDSDFRLTNLNQPLLAKGYESASLRPVPYAQIYLRPAGDLKTSPAEMAHFIQMMLNRGKLGDTQIVTPESILRMEYPQTTAAARAGLKDGYGFANYTSGRTVAVHGHNGGIAGFISTYGYMPDAGAGYAAFLNSTISGEALTEITKLLQDYLVVGQTLPQPPTASVAPSELEKFAGYYEKTNPRDQMLEFVYLLLGGRHVFVADGKLYEKGWIGKAMALVPVSANQFRTEEQPVASTIFFNDESGKPVMGDLGFYGDRSDPTWPTTRLVLVAGALVVMARSILFALVWIPMKLLGKLKSAGNLNVRYAPLIAVLALVAACFELTEIPDWYSGTFNMLTVGLWMLTWAFAVLSIWALWVSVRSFTREVKMAVRIHSLLVAIACCGIAGYLYYWGMIGPRLWAP